MEGVDLKKHENPGRCGGLRVWKIGKERKKTLVKNLTKKEPEHQMSFFSCLSLGDGRGNHVKMENSQCGGKEPEDSPTTALRISPGNVLETTGMCEEGGESRGEEEKTPIGREEAGDERTESLTGVVC